MGRYRVETTVIETTAKGVIVDAPNYFQAKAAAQRGEGEPDGRGSSWSIERTAGAVIEVEPAEEPADDG